MESPKVKAMREMLRQEERDEAEEESGRSQNAEVQADEVAIPEEQLEAERDESAVPSITKLPPIV